ncbi:hypothetical protein CLOP_g10491 [Closterium sp. NIES-67]|nr:hypothetical protein CLOP_g10491 [Closterium sp. NIES-67]
MRPGDDVKPVLDKIKDTYARMAAAGSSVSQLQQCTKIISVLDNSWDNLIPTLNSQQDQWIPDHMTPRTDLLDEVKPPGKIKYVAAASGALLPVIGVGNAKVKGANGELVGLGNVPLVEGSRYVLTIVDDHTRAVWVYPLKSKGEVAADVLKEWMPRAQRECGHKEGGAAEVEQQQQQHESPPRVPHPPERPRRDVRPPVRLTYGGRGKPNVVQAGSAITSKMIYRHKYGPEGELTCYKSRLVARGFQQTKGKDYDEVFAPVGKGTTLRVLLAIAALLGWKIWQMDIRRADAGDAVQVLQDGLARVANLDGLVGKGQMSKLGFL